MGQLGQKLPSLDRRSLVKELTRAYADEWFAHYNYQFVANALRGHHSPAVIELLHRKSADGLARANALAERILELGAPPVAKLTDLVKHATDKPFKLPASLSNTEAVLKAVLDAERTSIRTYETLERDTRENDVVTNFLMRQYLAAAVRGEEELERLIGDPAPQMNGTKN